MSTHSAKAQYDRDYTLAGNVSLGEQQGAPTVVSGVGADFTLQTVDNGVQTDILVTSVTKVGGIENWSLRYGTSDFNEVGYSMVEGLPGTLIIVGHRNAPGQQVDNYVLCISQATGGFIWDRQFGATGTYESARLIIDAKNVGGTNAFVVAGVIHNNGVNHLSVQAFAIDAYGSILWQNRYGEIAPPKFRHHEPTSLVITDQLEVVIAGHAHNNGQGASLFTMGINTSDGDLLPTGLIFYDIMGDLVQERFPSITRELSNQGYILSFNSVFPGNLERIGVIRLDNNRDNVWTHIHSISGNPDVQRPVNMIMNGVFYEMSLFVKDDVASTYGNPGLLKIQFNGAFDAGYRYNISCSNTMDMWRDLSGEYVGKSTLPNPDNVFTLFRTDASGTIVGCDGSAIPDMAEFIVVNESIDHPMNVQLDYNEEEISPVCPSVNEPLTPSGACDPPILKTSIDGAEEELVTLYPNPTQGQFTLSVGQAEADGTIQIVDPLGRILFEQRLSSGDVRVDLSGEPKGFYTILVNTGDEVQTQKLIIE